MTAPSNLPTYSRSDVTPGIIHFGVGNFHRSHQAMYLDSLLRAGQARDWGIVGVGLLPVDAKMAAALRDQDFAYTLVERAGDGSATATQIRSIIDYIHAPAEPRKLLETLASPAIRIASLTVTEGGYNTSDTTGEFDTNNPEVRADVGASTPKTIFGVLAAGLHSRRSRGVAPFTIASCDNILGNGDVARRALVAFARLAYDDSFAEWIETNVSFPNSMVDRITPMTGGSEKVFVREVCGADEAWPVVCEPFKQWVIEDDFPGGRPNWEDAGAQLVCDVTPYEVLKLRMLNGSHQVMAYAGILRGHRYVHEAISDPVVVELVSRYMTDEAAPTLGPAPGIDVGEYQAELVERFANAHIGDTLRRLATDASDRIPKFLVPVALDRSHAGLGTRACATAIAGWAACAAQDLRSGRGLNDRQADAVASAVARMDAGPAAFLDNHAWFADLGEDPTFSRAFTDAFETLMQESRHA